MTFAVFAQTLTHEFVNFDDSFYVYRNADVVHGLSFKGIVWAFTAFHSYNWHPLTWLSHMLDCQFYGLNPAGHHLTSVLLHIATAVTLFLVLRETTGALWRSAFVAAVFAIHPLRVESVAWVAERKDVLSGLFFALAIAAYVHYARRPWSWRRYGLVMLLFILGLLSKPMLVTLPVVLLLLDYWPLQRKESVARLVIEKLPLLALSACSCVVTIRAQSTAVNLGEAFSLPLRLGNALVTCMVYLGEMVWQAGLAVYYPYPHGGLPRWEWMLATLLFAGISAVALWQRRKRPWILAGWLWYLVMLLPVVGIIQVGDQAHADRYTYLPQIGIYLAVTWAAAGWAAKCHAGPVAKASLAAAVLGALFVCTWRQTGYWQDSETLWRHTLACTRDNYVAEYNLATELADKEMPDEAIPHFQKALRIRPAYADAWNNLGDAFSSENRTNEAIGCFQQAIQARPDYLLARENLAASLLKAGKIDEAILQYQEALKMNPGNAGAHINFSRALLRAGRVDDAIAHLQQALRIDPGNAKAQNNLGNAYLQKGNVGEALVHFQQAMQIDPGDPWAKNNLAWTLATSPQAAFRDGNKAVELARQAGELVGEENPAVLHTLAAALAEAGRFPEAMETAQRGLQSAQAQSNAELAGQFQAEIQLFQAGKPFRSP